MTTIMLRESLRDVTQLSRGTAALLIIAASGGAEVQSETQAQARIRRRVSRRLGIGAEVVDGGVSFRVWAPKRRRVAVVVDGMEQPLTADDSGHFEGVVHGAGAGSRYAFKLDDDAKLYPDPASRYQPDGPDGTSAVVDAGAFTWSDSQWPGVSIAGQVLYEMHIGTLTPEGTFAAAAERLPAIADIGITCIEIMPLADFAGTFGWGYDGVNWFAPSRIYGAPDDLRRLVDRAHALGLGVILDVVYNHLGPRGNYLPPFSDDYVSKRYRTDWGTAINFDDAGAAGVRDHVLANVRHWVEEYHLDGLRVDATQDIHDASQEHILVAITRVGRAAAGWRSIIMIGENEPQDARLARPLTRNGFGFDALWNDDYHHSAMVAATGHAEAYYSDYTGAAQELVSAVKWGYLFQGQRYHWQRARRGAGCLDLPCSAFVTFLQNHDQVANSAHGLRLTALTSPGRMRALTALTLLAPGTPMLMQGQEFAASAPFLYFADHPGELAALVDRGRRAFLAQFRSLATPEGQAAIPGIGAASFERSVLDWRERETHGEAVALHKDLLRLRRTDPTFSAQARRGVDGAVLAPECFVLRFFGVDKGEPVPGHDDDRLVVVNLGLQRRFVPAAEPLLGISRSKRWQILWSSEDVRYGGSGTPAVDDDEHGWTVAGHAAVVLKAITRG